MSNLSVSPEEEPSPQDRLPPWKFVFLFARLSLAQFALLALRLFLFMLCMAGGVVDSHTAGWGYVESVCEPGVGSYILIGGLSLALWAYGLRAARRMLRSPIQS